MQRAVITVLGNDQPGIIYHVTQVLYQCNVNIQDISQTILQEVFSMVMIVDITNCNVPFDTLVDELEKVGEKLHMTIHTQHEDIFNSMHKI